MPIYSLYDKLGIPKTATQDEIRQAYKEKAREHHSDKGHENSDEAFRILQDAYKILSDPEEREKYDKTGDDLSLTFTVQNFGDSSSTSNNSLVVQTTYTVDEIFRLAKLSSDEIIKEVKKNPELGLAILEDRSLREKINVLEIIQMAVKNEKIAIKLFSAPELLDWVLSKFYHYYYLCDIAQAFPSACRLILREPRLTIKLNGSHLYKLFTQYSTDDGIKTLITDNPNLNTKLTAYTNLMSYCEKATKPNFQEIKHDTFIQWLKTAEILGDSSEIKKLIKLYPKIVSFLANDDSLLQEYLDGLLDLASQDEALALALLSNLQQKALSFRCSLLDLKLFYIARNFLKACELILSTPKLSQKLRTTYLFDLVQIHPDILRLIQKDPNLNKKYLACKNLYDFSKNSSDLESTISGNLLVEQLHAAELSVFDIHEWAIKFPKLAIALCENVSLLAPVMSDPYGVFWGAKVHESAAMALLRNTDFINSLASRAYSPHEPKSYVAILANAHSKACEVILKNSSFAAQLSGRELFELIERYPSMATRLIADSYELSNTLKAYTLFHKVQQQKNNSDLKMQKVSSAAIREIPGQEDYDVALFYKGIETNRPLFLRHLLLAAKKGHLDAFNLLLTAVKSRINSEKGFYYELEIAFVYLNENNPLSNPEASLFWLQESIKKGSGEAAYLLASYWNITSLEDFLNFLNYSATNKNQLYTFLYQQALQNQDERLAFYFLTKINAPSPVDLYQLGTLQLNILATQQREEIQEKLAEENKPPLDLESLTQALNKAEYKKIRLQKALPYFLRAANAGDTLSAPISWRLFLELLQLSEVTDNILNLAFKNRVLMEEILNTDWLAIIKSNSSIPESEQNNAKLSEVLFHFLSQEKIILALSDKQLLNALELTNHKIPDLINLYCNHNIIYEKILSFVQKKLISHSTTAEKNNAVPELVINYCNYLQSKNPEDEKKFLVLSLLQILKKGDIEPYLKWIEKIIKGISPEHPLIKNLQYLILSKSSFHFQTILAFTKDFIKKGVFTDEALNLLYKKNTTWIIEQAKLSLNNRGAVLRMTGRTLEEQESIIKRAIEEQSIVSTSDLLENQENNLLIGNAAFNLSIIYYQQSKSKLPVQPSLLEKAHHWLLKAKELAYITEESANRYAKMFDLPFYFSTLHVAFYEGIKTNNVETLYSVFGQLPKYLKSENQKKQLLELTQQIETYKAQLKDSPQESTLLDGLIGKLTQSIQLTFEKDYIADTKYTLDKRNQQFFEIIQTWKEEIPLSIRFQQWIQEVVDLLLKLFQRVGYEHYNDHAPASIAPHSVIFSTTQSSLVQIAKICEQEIKTALLQR